MKNICMVRLQAVKEKGIKYETNKITGPDTAAGILKEFINECCYTDRENFIVMMLDTKNKVTGLTITSIGTLNSSLVHPREVFKAAILTNAASIILAHNHPSGDPTPSREDMDITKRLAETGKLLGIEILDHVIIGDTHKSLKASGLM